LKKRTGYMLRRAYHLVHEQGKTAFGRHDLRPQQFGILLFLEHAPGSNQTVVGAALGIQGPNFGGMLAPLVDRGLVQRSTSALDGRVFVLDLTRRGKNLLRAAKKVDTRLNASFDRKLGPGGRQRLLELLGKLAQID
jgi:DNA-binding MarR family transcriptional regulator